MSALETMRSRQHVEALRGVTLPETGVELAIKRGAAFMTTKSGEKMAAPKNTVGEENRRGGRGGPRGGRGGPRSSSRPPEGGDGGAPAAEAPAAS